MSRETETGHFILSGANQLLVRLEATEDHNHVVWVSTISGEDFFNGPWAIEATGVSDNSQQAIQEASSYFTSPSYKRVTLLQAIRDEPKKTFRLT